MDKRPIDYLFVQDKDSGYWYLKIDSVEKIIDYHKKTENRYSGAIDLYIKLHQEMTKSGRSGSVLSLIYEKPLNERISLMESRDFKYMQAAMIKAQEVEGTIFDGFRCLNMEIGQGEYEDLLQYGACYINPSGGRCPVSEYSQFIRRKELIFPTFKVSDIRVKQWKGGTHWYAFVGDMQVRDGDNTKWNTRQEAYNRALQAVGG